MRLSDSEFSLTVGSQRTITATVEPDVADYDGIVWASSDPKVASVVDGTVRGVRDGVTQITATASGVTSLPCSVTVRSIRVSSVSINKTSAELTVGQAIKLEASINPQNATNQTIFWSSSDVFVATVSNAGLVVSQNPGTATITLRSDDGDHTATCRVTVKAKVVNVTGVSLSKTSMTLTEGESDQLEATISPSNATDKTVNWTSSNTSVATVASDGTITAKAAGTATITVKSEDQGKTATCEITVKAQVIDVTGITLSQSTISVKEEATLQLKATVKPSNATNQEVSWSSENTGIATVASDGTVTGVTEGTTTITAKSADGKVTATCKVTVIGEYVDFPDPNFEKYIIENFDLNGDGKISLSEANKVKSIKILADDIESVQGIEYMTNLVSLYVGGWYNNTTGQFSGRLTSLDVSNNTALTSLYCRGNQLTSLDVSNNTELDYLSCDFNQMTSLDVSKNTLLKTLYCDDNQLSSLVLPNSTELKECRCNSNQLTSLDVSKNTALYYLSCDSNQLTTLDVSKNTALKYLDCYLNQLTTLDVSKNTALTDLDCSPMSTLKTLYVSSGQSIEGVTVNRSTNRVPSGTSIKTK